MLREEGGWAGRGQARGREPGEVAVTLRKDKDSIDLPKVSEAGSLGPRSSWG